MDVFVQRLVGGRNRKGLTQTELARELGVHLRSIQNWEAGLTEPRGRDLRKLSSILNLSIPFLYGLDEPPEGASGAAQWQRTQDRGDEVRFLAHEYLDKVMDAAKGDRHQKHWLFVELQRRMPLPSSAADAVAADILSEEEPSGGRPSRGSSRSRATGGPSARTSGRARASGTLSTKRP